jgi:hypothetical protein
MGHGDVTAAVANLLGATDAAALVKPARSALEAATDEQLLVSVFGVGTNTLRGDKNKEEAVKDALLLSARTMYHFEAPVIRLRTSPGNVYLIRRAFVGREKREYLVIGFTPDGLFDWWATLTDSVTANLDEDVGELAKVLR